MSRREYAGDRSIGTGHYNFARQPARDQTGSISSDEGHITEEDHHHGEEQGTRKREGRNSDRGQFGRGHPCIRNIAGTLQCRTQPIGFARNQ